MDTKQFYATKAQLLSSMIQQIVDMQITIVDLQRVESTAPVPDIQEALDLWRSAEALKDTTIHLLSAINAMRVV